MTKNELAFPDGFIYVIRLNSSDFLCDSYPMYTSNLKYAKQFRTKKNAEYRAELIRKHMELDVEVVTVGFHVVEGA